MTEFHDPHGAAPPRRELPSRGFLSTPHIQAYHGARFFIELLETHTAAAKKRWAEVGGTDEMLDFAVSGDALERQALSEAVQVFCAMAVEAAVNLLGVISLGEQSFARIEKKPQPKKLRTLLHLINPTLTNQMEELIEVAENLSEARNTFVHPKAQDGAAVASVGPRRGDLESAREAMDEMLLFFKLLKEYEPFYASFFGLW